jgi:hypothetical protein
VHQICKKGKYKYKHPLRHYFSFKKILGQTYLSHGAPLVTQHKTSNSETKVDVAPANNPFAPLNLIFH